jgi:hypothetical protein
MPSVFARAILFRNALDHITDKDVEGDGMIAFYKSLVGEWRGLLACIAWNSSDIEVRRVVLEYSDGKPTASTANIYEPKGAFGNLLFERKPLWCDPATNKPVIDIIRYRKRVVGACSPDSFLFTSAAYRLEHSAPYIEAGRFRDPLKGEVDPARLGLLKGYVDHVRESISSKFIKHFDELDKASAYLKPHYESLSSNLQDWSREIDAYAEKKGYRLQAQIPEISGFKPPFSLLLNHTTELYGFHGVISGAKGMGGGFLFDPRKVLLPAGSEIAMVEMRAGADPLAGRAVHLLKAEVQGADRGKYAYFTVPLTPLGLAVFGRNIGTLLGQGGADMRSRLTGNYDPATDELAVTLKIVAEDEREIVREQKYRVGSKMIKNRDVLLWPNFISEHWGRYYLFNELPHNDSGLQATPILAYMQDGLLGLTPPAAEDGTPDVALLLAAENGKARKEGQGPNVKLHIGADHAIADVPYKYEIYESDTPFIGLRISQGGKDQGYVLLKYGGEGEGALRNLISDGRQMEPVGLGVDFGSTNTSVAYFSAKAGEPQGLRFKNRRISLFSSEKERESGQQFAIENEIFFFQNEPVQSNSIKSVLTLHDHRRIVRGSDQRTAESLAAEPIKGGFPCFEKNLPIDTASNSRYHLKYGSAGKVDLVHNMKWSDGVENSYKAAYLSSLLLHVYAHLFEEGLIPVKLKWSYPSAMSQDMIGKYNEIWSRMGHISPLVNERRLIISEATGRLSSRAASKTVSGSVASKWGLSQAPTATSPSSPVPHNDGSKRFNFVDLNESTSLTEACAVANYIATNRNVNTTKEYLTLCFDVGGSTTDIMALCMMKDPQGDPPRLAMVKQNSIRFAAQRIAQASKHSHRFRDVLLDMCEKHGFSFSGLNKGENKYSPDTAPYYFEQIIDRLDETDLPSFYKSLHAKCPELFWVNLYVTGLIMFYAGQLARKLQTDIARSSERMDSDAEWAPNVNVLFAGKGARIFDWFHEVNPEAARRYYLDLFIEGYGGGIPEHRVRLRMPAESAPGSDVKYEVSKGLAKPTKALLVPQENTAVEIIGEDHFKYHGTTLSSTDSMTGELMGLLEGGASFYSSPPSGELPCPRFAAFADIYYTAATELFGLRLTRQDFLNGFMNLNIEAYIQAQPEFQQAMKAKREGLTEQFDYVAPIIILEGMKFLEDMILPKLANA